MSRRAPRSQRRAHNEQPIELLERRSGGEHERMEVDASVELPVRTTEQPEQLSDRPFLYACRKWWGHHVRTTVPEVDCRDHFALERTFLAWQRTALAFSNLAVTIAQLFRLSLPGTKHPYVVRLHDFGIPLSSVCVCVSLIFCLLGTIRFFRQQEGMVHRRIVHAGGWELNLVGVVTLLLLVAAFVIVLYRDIMSTDF